MEFSRLLRKRQARLNFRGFVLKSGLGAVNGVAAAVLHWSGDVFSNLKGFCK